MRIDGVSYELDWRKFKPGTSFFIPCLDAEKAREQLARTTSRLGVNVLTKILIVDGVRGLRVWRT
jgi:hypothetical protein